MTIEQRLAEIQQRRRMRRAGELLEDFDWLLRLVYSMQAVVEAAEEWHGRFWLGRRLDEALQAYRREREGK